MLEWFSSTKNERIEIISNNHTEEIRDVKFPVKLHIRNFLSKEKFHRPFDDCFPESMVEQTSSLLHTIFVVGLRLFSRFVSAKGFKFQLNLD